MLCLYLFCNFFLNFAPKNLFRKVNQETILRNFFTKQKINHKMEKILNKIQNSKLTKNNNNINCKDHCGTRNNIFQQQQKKQQQC